MGSPGRLRSSTIRPTKCSSRKRPSPGLEGYEKGQVSELGAVNVMTGIYTGRSPKDKFIVMDDTSKDTVWWTSDEYKNDNHPASQEAWAALKEIAKKELSNKRLFVVDAFCGANKDTRMAIRFIVEVAWQAHFVTNMFIKPDRGRAEELRAGLRRLQRLQGEGGELQGAGPQLRDRRGLQPHHPRAGDRQHLVRRRDEEGHVLHDELLSCRSRAWLPCTAPPTRT